VVVGVVWGWDEGALPGQPSRAVRVLLVVLLVVLLTGHQKAQRGGCWWVWV